MRKPTDPAKPRTARAKVAETAEARLARALRKLSHSNCRLLPVTEGEAHSWRIGALDDRRPMHHIANELAAELLWRGLVVRVAVGETATSAQAYRLSPAGAAWLRRRLASEDAFRAQHQLRGKSTPPARTPRASRSTAVTNDAESPLGWLRQRKDKSGRPFVDAAQYEAGERLRRDYTIARMMPRVTSSWESPAAGGARRAAPGDGIAVRDAALAARTRVQKALGEVGPELSGILVDVCCHLKGLEGIEREEDWPQRSAKIVLGLALDALARHYGLTTAAETADGTKRARLLHWGAEDYRPDLDGWA